MRKNYVICLLGALLLMANFKTQAQKPEFEQIFYLQAPDTTTFVAMVSNVSLEYQFHWMLRDYDDYANHGDSAAIILDTVINQSEIAFQVDLVHLLTPGGKYKSWAWITDAVHGTSDTATDYFLTTWFDAIPRDPLADQVSILSLGNQQVRIIVPDELVGGYVHYFDGAGRDVLSLRITDLQVAPDQGMLATGNYSVCVTRNNGWMVTSKKVYINH